MKNIYVVISIFLSFSFVNAHTIINAQVTPGYVMNPQTRTFFVDSSGAMALKIVELKTNKTNLERIGQLSAYATKLLKSEIAKINLSTQLVDQQQGGPICADAPGYTVSIIKNGVNDIIYRKADCHEWRLQTYEGQQIINLAMAFLDF